MVICPLLEISKPEAKFAFSESTR